MSKTGIGMAEYAISKIGTPYFYGSKMQVLTKQYMDAMHALYPKIVTDKYIKKAWDRGQVGKTNTDCSGLPGAYRKKQIGSSQLYQTAYTRLPISEVKNFAPGVILWKSGHVGVYIGMENGVPMCVEAKGIDYGVVKTKVSATNWQCGLTFSDIDYTYDVKVPGTYKGANPYKEPSKTVQKGSKGEDVKWVQWELREAGFDRAFCYNGRTYGAVAIDGDAGKITDAAIRAYQASCKIAVDGKCGPKTREKLKANA
ncbi:MAG: peptidoglycan-binding protein [Acetatifactor sp.]|nr:peptidoglycan-binding protein [Acetatifactor sp.]